MVTFVATAYKEVFEINLFISSLQLQTDSRWKCIVICDGPNEYIQQAVRHIDDDRVTLHTTETNTGYWGHYNRKYALEHIVTTETVIQTSIQDYYIPTTVSEILNVDPRYNFIYFDSLHNHFGYNRLVAEPKVNNIDWGNFAIKTSLAKKIGINNVESSTCDGLFVENCFKSQEIRPYKINKILTIHN